MQAVAVTGLVTRKGQVTIPLAMRRALGIGEGDRVVVRLENGIIVVRPAAGLLAELTAAAGVDRAAPITDDEIDEVVAASFAEDEEGLMEDLGIGPAVHGRQRAAEDDPAGPPRALAPGDHAA